jgi:hypothetical protein
MSNPKISVVLPVLAPTPVLRAMTEFCIKTLRGNADDKTFELIVVEAGESYFDPVKNSSLWNPCSVEDPLGSPLVNKYLNFNPKIGGIKETNQGIRAASGEFIVTMGNDVFVPEHWDTELLRCFQERKDCGIAALSAAEPGASIGPPEPLDLIVEGMYSPFNMFRKGWEYCEDYKRIYQDSDLVMRICDTGLRSYRSCRARVHHLLRMTTDAVDKAEHDAQIGPDEKLFYTRWGRNPLAIFAMIRCGQYHYGREHISWTSPINLHYNPNEA